MTDVLDRLAAANPVAASERPPIGDVWRKLAAIDASAPAPRRRGRRTRGLAMAAGVVVPVLIVVALALGQLGTTAKRGAAAHGNPSPHRGSPRPSRTTLDPVLQQAAQDALGHRIGTIVAIDPQTGAIRALAGGPAMTRSARRFVAGDVIDMVIAAAALDTGRATPDTLLAAPATVRIDGVTVRDRAGLDRGLISLRDALSESADTAFAGLAARLGHATLAGYLRRFDLPGTRTSLAALATGAGVVITPLQIATVASAAADGGTLALPRLAAGDQLRLSRVISRTAARSLAAMLRDVVRHGTGTGAAVPGLEVAGKTGIGGGDLWFVGFAPASAPRLVVAVAVHAHGFGGTVAGPIADRVLRAGLRAP